MNRKVCTERYTISAVKSYQQNMSSLSICAEVSMSYHWLQHAALGTPSAGWCFSPGTGEHEPAAPSLGLWHTGQTRPGTPEAAAADTGLCGASEQMLGAPGSIHPAGESREADEHKKKHATKAKIPEKTATLSRSWASQIATGLPWEPNISGN